LKSEIQYIVGHVKNKYYIWIKQCNWYIIDEFVAVQRKADRYRDKNQHLVVSITGRKL
jgi:hypothetical protein